MAEQVVNPIEVLDHSDKTRGGRHFPSLVLLRVTHVQNVRNLR